MQPAYEVGRAAADLLTRRITQPDHPPSRVVLPTELQVRASSTRPKN